MAYVAGRTVPSRPKDAGRIEEPAKPGRIRQDRLNESAARRQTETLTAWTRTADAPVPAAPAPLQAKSAALVFDGPPMLSIFVEDQNTNIGRRNVHILKQGYTYTLGGGKSDFLIFLVPLPAHIGEIYFDGQGCSFIPRRPEFFPDLGAAPVRDCIGKTIRVVSEKKYELRFRIEQYEDPLKSLNRLLTSIDVSPKQTAWVKQNSPGAQNPRRPGAGFTLPRPR
jgi:hypothetical protein